MAILESMNFNKGECSYYVHISLLFCADTTIYRKSAIKVHMFSKKATKINEIFTVDLTLCSKCQIYGEDFVNFCGLLENTNFNM